MLSLVPPAPVAPVSPSQATGLVPIDEATRKILRAKAAGYVATLVSYGANDPDFGSTADQLINLGRREVQVLADQSTRFLDRSSRALNRDDVGASLGRLRAIVERLDPNRQGNLLAPKRVLGIFPAGSKLTAYFDQYPSAQASIEQLLSALGAGRDELLSDNIAIQRERRQMWDEMGELEKAIHLANQLDAMLEAKAASLDAVDPAKAHGIRDAALYQLRQRIADLVTHLAVAMQGYMTLELIRKSNLELIKGVDRASTTTIAALRTAISVAQTLAGQRLVLDRIAALNDSASTLIERSGDMARDSSRIVEGASATVDVEKLQRAFANIYATMDEVDAFKAETKDNMRQTVESLTTETGRAQARISARDSQIAPGGTFDLG